MPVSTPSFRVGLRVRDVHAAVRFYNGLGFTEVMSVPNPEGRKVFAILDRNGVNLCVDALVGMPFPDTERERQIQHGPLGLGVALGLEVTDLESVYGYCRSENCEITSEPEDAPWSARVFEFIDPFGYVWEISQEIARMTTTEAATSVGASWFGQSN